MARKYELRERAESVAETRARIVEATVALHAQLGPARTTITAIADRANVQRLTVYRHFPDELSLFVYRQLVRETLAEGWQVRGRKRTVLNAVIGHAIAFETWRSLTGREGLSDQAAAEAMVEFVSAVAD